MLYPPTGSGVVWNGLISVTEGEDGGQVDSYYMDGVKYRDEVQERDFEASIVAFSAPKEFDACLGDVSIFPGFILTGQPKTAFGMCYQTRTNISDYKIHLIYNATANVSGINRTTRAKRVDPMEQTFKLIAVPPPIVFGAGPSYKPSSHLTIDSRKASVAGMTRLRNALYGTLIAAPYLPTQSAVYTLLGG